MHRSSRPPSLALWRVERSRPNFMPALLRQNGILWIYIATRFPYEHPLRRCDPNSGMPARPTAADCLKTQVFSLGKTAVFTKYYAHGKPKPAGALSQKAINKAQRDINTLFLTVPKKRLSLCLNNAHAAQIAHGAQVELQRKSKF